MLTVKELIKKLSIVPDDSRVTFSLNTISYSMDIGFLRIDKIDEHHVEILLED